MEEKPVQIVREPWDFLVILDTCRYDIFKKVYGEFFTDGKLRKAISPATWTREWLIKCFPGKYDDIVYVSGNPNINSKFKMISKRYVFEANKHFFKIVDVWNFGWDDTVGQVPPKNVNKAFHKYYLKYPKKRFILHYQQPHYPWISMGGEPKPFKKRYRTIYNHGVKGLKPYSLPVRILRKVPEVFYWNTRKILNIPSKSNKEQYYRFHGRKGMIQAYTQELKLGLKYVNMLVEAIDGYWLITADHGEQLGERGKYGHPAGNRVREQLEVPWFEIK